MAYSYAQHYGYVYSIALFILVAAGIYPITILSVLPCFAHVSFFNCFAMAIVCYHFLIL